MRHAKPWIALLVVVGFSLAFAFLPVAHALAHAVRFIRALGPFGIGLYVVLFVSSAILLVPTTPVFVAAGLLYGVAWGALLLTVLSIATDLLTMLIVRTGARTWIERRVAKHKNLAAVDVAVEKHSLWLGSLLRLSLFVPFGPLNYALGATSMPPWQHVVTNAIGMTPCNVLMAYAGSLISDVTRLDTSALPGFWHQVALWGGLAVTIAASIAVGVTTKREKTRSGSGDSVVSDQVANA